MTLTKSTESSASTPAPKENTAAVAAPVFVINQGDFPLAEPFAHTMFQPNQRVEVPRISPWLAMQIEAGLFIQV